MGHTVYVTFRLVCHSYCLNLPVTRLVVNNLFRQQQIRSHHSSTVLTLCDGEPPVTGAFPYKGTVMRKAFQSRDIIMKHHCICTIRVEQHQSYLAARWRISLFVSYFSSYESSFSGQIGCQYLGFFCEDFSASQTNIDFLIEYKWPSRHHSDNIGYNSSGFDG